MDNSRSSSWRDQRRGDRHQSSNNSGSGGGGRDDGSNQSSEHSVDHQWGSSSRHSSPPQRSDQPFQHHHHHQQRGQHERHQQRGQQFDRQQQQRQQRQHHQHQHQQRGAVDRSEFSSYTPLAGGGGGGDGNGNASNNSSSSSRYSSQQQQQQQRGGEQQHDQWGRNRQDRHPSAAAASAVAAGSGHNHWQDGDHHHHHQQQQHRRNERPQFRRLASGENYGGLLVSSPSSTSSQQQQSSGSVAVVDHRSNNSGSSSAAARNSTSLRSGAAPAAINATTGTATASSAMRTSGSNSGSGNINNEKSKKKKNDINSNDNDEPSPPKRKVRWGENIEHVTVTENPPPTTTTTTGNTPVGATATAHHRPTPSSIETIKANVLLQATAKKKKKPPNMCRLPNHTHKWYDCPNNPHSPKFCGIDHRTMNSSTDALATRGAVLAANKKKKNAVGGGKNAAAKSGAKQPLTAKLHSSGATAATASAAVAIPKKPSPRSAALLASSLLKAPPAILHSSKSSNRTSSTSAAITSSSSSSSNLFNTSNSARPIPRKMPSETSMGSAGRGGGLGGGGGGSSIPKKRKFQQQQSQQVQQAQQPLHNQPHNQPHTQPHHPHPHHPHPHQHIQSQQQQQQQPSSLLTTAESHRMEYKSGTWRKKRVARAPAAGNDVIALNLPRKGRMVNKGGRGQVKSVFSPRGREGAVAVGDDVVVGVGSGGGEQQHQQHHHHVGVSSGVRDGLTGEQHCMTERSDADAAMGGTVAAAAVGGDGRAVMAASGSGSLSSHDHSSPEKKQRQKGNDSLGLEDTDESDMSISDTDGGSSSFGKASQKKKQPSLLDDGYCKKTDESVKKKAEEMAKARQQQSNSGGPTKKKKKKEIIQLDFSCSSDDDEDDLPLQQRYRQQRKQTLPEQPPPPPLPLQQKQQPVQQLQSQSQQQLHAGDNNDDDDDDDDDMPLKQLHQQHKQSSKKANKGNEGDAFSSDDDMPMNQLYRRQQSEEKEVDHRSSSQGNNNDINNESDKVLLPHVDNNGKKKKKKKKGTAAAAAEEEEEGKNDNYVSDNGNNVEHSDGENNEGKEGDEDNADDNGNGKDDGDQGSPTAVTMELIDEDAAMIVEFETDLFGLIEQTIKLDYQWKERQEQLVQHYRQWGEAEEEGDSLSPTLDGGADKQDKQDVMVGDEGPSEMNHVDVEDEAVQDHRGENELNDAQDAAADGDDEESQKTGSSTLPSHDASNVQDAVVEEEGAAIEIDLKTGPRSNNVTSASNTTCGGGDNDVLILPAESTPNKSNTEDDLSLSPAVSKPSLAMQIDQDSKSTKENIENRQSSNILDAPPASVGAAVATTPEAADDVSQDGAAEKKIAASSSSTAPPPSQNQKEAASGTITKENAKISSKEKKKDKARRQKEKEMKKKKQKKKQRKETRKALSLEGSHNAAKRQKLSGDNNSSPADEQPWTEEEKRLYSEGVNQCGNNWGKIASDFVTSRSPHQIREYAKILAIGQGGGGGGGSSSISSTAKKPACGEELNNVAANAERPVILVNSNTAGLLSVPANINGVQDNMEVTNAHQEEAMMEEHSNDDGNKENRPDTECSDLLNGDDDDDVPAFVTCDKCSMVFTDHDEAWEHEKHCMISSTNEGEDDKDGAVLVQQGKKEKKVFDDRNALALYLIDLHSSTDGGKSSVNEEDWIFFRPISPEDPSGHQHDQQQRQGGNGDSSTGRDTAQSPPNDASLGPTQNKDDNKWNDDDGCDGNDDDDDDDDDDDYQDMNLVKHLCSTRIDPATGLPTQKLTVMCGDSETLYDFRVDIKQSTIPNAGHGAFLTYLGARVLKPRAEARSARLIGEHVIETAIDTHNPLVAETLGGRRMTITLAGENLHYNDNNIYWSKKRSDKFMEFESKNGSPCSKSPSPNKKTRRWSSVESFNESEVKCKVHEEVQELRRKIPNGNGIGFLGINAESDYQPDDDKIFWSHPDAFELGRYGPHRPDDRKINLHFDFKNFIQNYEPSEWSYEVPETMLGHSQIVDITDDTTGEVHSLAKSHTPIYVNEVGHNANLHTNVLIRDKNDRSIYYYVCISEERALKKGDTVELLVDYGGHYEQVRERKGYGLFNMSGHVGGDEEDEGAKLQRNFLEREEVEKDISSLMVYEMFYLVEFLTQIYDSTNEAMNNISTLKYRDLVARRRLHWIGEKLAAKVEQYKADPVVVTDTDFLSSIRESLRKWNFVLLPKVFHLLNNELRNILLDELTEELLYETRSCLPSPLDETVWSKLAVDLTRKSTRIMAQYLYCYSGPIDVRKHFLAVALLKEAKNSAIALQEGSHAINDRGNKNTLEGSLDDHIKLLSFKSRHQAIKKKHLLDESSKRMINVYGSEQTIRFATAAAMADIQAYYDAVDLCGMESYYVPGKTRIVSESDCSIVSMYDPGTTPNDSEKRSPQFHWMARSVDAFKNRDASVNEQWYLENQVLLIVHLLASTCVDWKQTNGYMLENLCKEINLDVNNARRTLSQGAVNATWPGQEIKPAYSSALGNGDTTVTSRRGRRGFSSKRVHNNPDHEFPGWLRKGVPRSNSVGSHIDNYWIHPELPDIAVRSRVGVKTLMEYMESKGVGVRAAYEEYQGVTKFFRLNFMNG